MSEGMKQERPKSNWAQIISAAVSVVAIVVVVTQVYFISRNFKEASARQVYMSYSEASLRYPELLEPDLVALKAMPKEYTRYKNFVYHMLFAYDEILEVYDTPEWRKSLAIDIKLHAPYICNDMPVADDMSFFKKIRDVLKEVRAGCRDAAAKDK